MRRRDNGPTPGLDRAWPPEAGLRRFTGQALRWFKDDAHLRRLGGGDHASAQVDHCELTRTFEMLLCPLQHRRQQGRIQGALPFHAGDHAQMVLALFDGLGEAEGKGRASLPHAGGRPFFQVPVEQPLAQPEHTEDQQNRQRRRDSSHLPVQSDRHSHDCTRPSLPR